MSDGRSRFIELPNTRLWIDERGQGKAMVFIHGFGLDLGMWDPQFAHFSGRFRCLRYDLRGFGRSDMPAAAPYSHAEDLHRLLDACGIDRAILVGLSLGANVAMHFATLYPDRLAGLVLAASSLPGYPWRWSDERPREAAGDVARQSGAEAARRFWSQHALFASARENPGVAAALAAMTARYSAWHWANRDPHEPIPPLQPLLKEIRVPTLVVSGERDIEPYRDIAGVIAGEIPGSMLKRFANAGHLVTMEAPDAFNLAVSELVEEI